MKKGRFTKEQMVGFLREANHAPMARIAKKHGISEQMTDMWRQRFCGMNAALRAFIAEQREQPPKRRPASRG